ncbi:MAG: DciA family protein [Vicinamibacterales bacterium]
MDHVRQVLPSALAGAVRQAPLTPEKVAFAWRAACGAAIAKVTQVTLDANGVLVVRTADGRWAAELHRLRRELVLRLEPWLGAGVVTKIDVAGRADPGARRASRRPALEPEKPSS